LCFVALSIAAAGRWSVSGDIDPTVVVFLASSLFGTVQLCGLSLIAEYIGRTYLQTLGRPLFLVDQVVSRPNVQSKEDDHASR
jgi:hypothetical protein